MQTTYSEMSFESINKNWLDLGKTALQTSSPQLVGYWIPTKLVWKQQHKNKKEHIHWAGYRYMRQELQITAQNAFLALSQDNTKIVLADCFTIKFVLAYNVYNV